MNWIKSVSMITLSAKAIERIEQFLEKDSRRPELFRIVVRGQDQDGFIYEFLLQRAEAQSATDLIFATGTFTTIIDAGSYEHMKGSHVDWQHSVNGSGFQVSNPNKPLNIVDATLDIAKDVENNITDHNSNTNPHYR